MASATPDNNASRPRNPPAESLDDRLRRVAERERLAAERERLAAERERLAAAQEQAGAERMLFAAIVENSDDAIYSMTLEGTITSWNRGAERLYSYAAAEMRGRHAKVLVPPECLEEADGIMAAISRGAEFALLDTVRLTKAGTRVDVSLRVGPVLDTGGRIVGASMIAREITDGTRAAARLEAEREFTHALLESLQEGIAACDASGALTLFNRTKREMHGLPEQSLPVEQWAEHFDLYQADGVTPLPTSEIPLRRALAGEVVRDAEMVIAPRHGAARTLLAGDQAIYGTRGQKLGAVVTMRDVTERRWAERELARMAAIVASSEEAILAVTLDGTIASWNKSAERLYGYTEAEMVGRHGSTLAPLSEQTLVSKAIARLMRGETLEPMEVVRTRKDGSSVDVSLSFSLLKDEAGQVIGASCTSRDITARKQAEAVLAESEARLRLLTDAAFEGIAVSRDGVLASVSPAFAALFGYPSPDAMAGLLGTTLAAPESLALIGQKIAQGDEEPYEATLQRRDGTTFVAELRGRGAQLDGQPVRITAVRDISGRRAMEEALRESRRFAQSIAEHSASLIFVFDLDTMSNVYANRDVAEFLGYTPQQVADLGADLLPFMIHPDDLPALLAHFGGFAETQDGEVVEFEYRARHAGGDWRWVWNREVVFKRHADGRPRQILGNAQDVTERRRQEEAVREYAEQLRRSEARLAGAQRVAGIGNWEYDIGADKITWSAELFRLFEMEPAEHAPTTAALLARYHPDDAPMHEKLTQQAVRDGLPYEFDIRIVRRDGTLRWAHAVGRGERDAAGQVARLYGTLMDIHERKLAEERFRVLFEQSSDAHLLVAEDGLLDCNPAAVAMLRCTDISQVLSLHPAVLSPEFQPDGRRSSEKHVALDALAYAHGMQRFEWMHTRMDGAELLVEVTLTPVTLGSRRVLLAVWHDLTERKRAEEQIRDHAVVLEFQKGELEFQKGELQRANVALEALATTDGLTGLKNHRAFQERLAEEASRAARYNTPLSLILLDVDHFKQYNDAYGHPAGDAVLQTVARTLQAGARDTDIVARYGGEEFVLVLPQTDLHGAMIFAERLRASVQGQAWPLRPVTASFGVASLRLGEESGASLVARADTALYQSKAGSRNQVSAARV